MEFKRRKPRQTQRKITNDQSDYSNSLMSFYTTPPDCTISLHQFEDIAIQRLKVLKCIDDFHIKWRSDESDELKKLQRHKAIEEKLQQLERELRELQRKDKLDILHSVLHKVRNDDEKEMQHARKVDYISHFILRLVYCRTAELKKWFLQQEVDLFAMRFQILMSRKQRSTFIETNNLCYTPINTAEQQELKDVLIPATANMTAVKFDDTLYYKIPFEDVLELVKSRRVYLKLGYAYIPDYELSTLVVATFRAHLSHQLSITARILPQMEEDYRLLPLLSGLSKRYLGQNYGTNSAEDESLKAETIDSVANVSFPLCMKNMHHQLKSNHHLKNTARLQYGLFLKGIGMSLEESMRLWKIEFTKNPNIDAEKFEKQYSYQVRYLYGKEGKRANYNPHSCMKIIMSNQPGPGDNHGCPFKHYQPDTVKKQLAVEKLPTAHIDKIMNAVEGGHYQMACSHYFTASHSEYLRGSPDKVTMIEHPNQYFIESQKLMKGEHVPGVSHEQIPDSNGVGHSEENGELPSNEATATDPESAGLFTQEELASIVEDMDDEEGCI